MPDEKTNEPSAPVQDKPPVVAVTQDDINKLRSLYDSKLADALKAAEASAQALALAKADIETLKGQAKPDDLKAMEAARNMRAKEIALEEREKALDQVERVAEAKRLVDEAKAKYGVEISAEEIAKLPKDKMAATVLDKVLAAPKPEAKPVPGKPKLADLTRGSGQPERRLRAGISDEGIEDFLHRQGKI